jgi:hypothetical protein
MTLMKRFWYLSRHIKFRASMLYGDILGPRWVPCHHGMARPQVADGGRASRCGG